MDPTAKHKHLLLKSIKLLGAEGAHMIFRGRWGHTTEKFLQPGLYEADLIVLYAEGANRCVEVTTPQYAKATARRLARLPMPPSWVKEMHTWGPKDKRPVVERIGTSEWWEDETQDAAPKKE